MLSLTHSGYEDTDRDYRTPKNPASGHLILMHVPGLRASPGRGTRRTFGKETMLSGITV
jgi:hypothetical protein